MSTNQTTTDPIALLTKDCTDDIAILLFELDTRLAGFGRRLSTVTFDMTNGYDIQIETRDQSQ